MEERQLLTQDRKEENFFRLVENNQFEEIFADIEDYKITLPNFIRWVTKGIETTKQPVVWQDFLTKLTKKRLLFLHLPQDYISIIYNLLHSNTLTDYKKVSPLVELILENRGEHDLLNLFASQPTLTQNIVELLKALDENLQTLLLKKIIPLSIEKYNASLLNAIEKQWPTILSQFNEQATEDQIKKITLLLSLKNEKECLIISDWMSQFVNGFGKINSTGGLLTCAQLGERKSYPDNLTLLIGPKEFKEYLATLKNRPQSEERFVLAGVHWIAGIIRVNEKETTLLIFDSLGGEKPEKISAEAVAAIFAFHAIFPNSVIGFSALKRQHALSGCSVYSLDDGEHLGTINQYLEKKYKDIFDYALNNQIKTIQLVFVKNENSEEGEQEYIMVFKDTATKENGDNELGFVKIESSEEEQEFNVAFKDSLGKEDIDNEFKFSDFEEDAINEIEFGKFEEDAGSENKLTNAAQEEITINIILFDLPLSFTRTLQSQALLTHVIPNRTSDEQQQPVNKRGESAKVSVEHNMIKDLHEQKLVNIRLDRKLQSIAKYNFLLLVNTPLSKVQEAMHNHTLQGFIKRMTVADRPGKKLL